MLLGQPKGRGVGRPPKPYATTTLREFNGGWNIIDNELNLSPKFARIFDNVVRGTDGSVSVRYGNRLWADFKLGSTFNLAAPAGSTLVTTANSRKVTINWAAHPFATGNHITFDSTWDALNLGLTGNTFTVRSVNANSFEIHIRTPQTAAIAQVGGKTVVRDTHLAGGRLVNGVYYNGKLLVATSAGELLVVDDTKAAARVWDINGSVALPGAPAGWGPTDYVTFNPFAGKMQVHNGVDKPLEVDYNTNPITQYMGDPASGGSNAFVPIGDVAGSNSGYTVIGGLINRPNILSLSAHLSPGVYVGNTAPDDALEVDIGKVTSANNPAVIGVAELRSKLIIALRDTLIIGTLGITHEQTVGTVTSNVHEPDFKDSIPQHGTISQRTMVSLGNDLFMCDRIGVPSVAQSQQSGQLVPNRVSKLIGPALQLNLSRLSDATLRKQAFAVYNMRDNQYMLFLPKYDTADIRLLPANPITFLGSLGNHRFIVNAPAHGFDVNDKVILSGASSIGLNPAAQINGTWRVYAVVDDDNIVIENAAYTFPNLNVNGGGSAVSIQPVNESKVGYILVYDPEMRIKAWSRFTDLDFDWGARSLIGRVFFGKGGKIYEHGTPEHPFAADGIGDYDTVTWMNGMPYKKGYRILSNDIVYVALEDHTSSAAGTFAQDRAAFPNRWEEYKGKPIKFVWEWPWADFDTRLEVKALRNVFVDATGKGKFNFNIFVDQLYKDLETGDLTPARCLTFTAANAGGFGAGPQAYGLGRRVREQLIWPMPVIGMLHKFRIEGETTDPIRFVAVTVVYNSGTMKR